MLSPVNRVVHLEVKVEVSELSINSLAEWMCERGAAVLESVVQQVVLQAQEEAFAGVEQGKAEWGCTSCGVVHERAEGWTRRGSRERTMRTSRGVLRVMLLQSTCGACRKTQAPWAETLGLGDRQRVSAELKRKAVERVPRLSYRGSADELQECLGVSLSPSTLHRWVQEVAGWVRLTPDEQAKALIADGTKVRAGKRADLEDLRMAFQLTGRSEEKGRPRAHLRLVGLDIGLGSWRRVLRGDTHTELIVTDAEAAVESHIRQRYPNARHQFCEWHVGYSLDYSLREDGVPLEERRALRKELGRILWGRSSQARKRVRFDRLVRRMACYPTTHKQLLRASDHILFPEPSSERTSSLIERQMREVDRRAWIGVRWSVSGLRNLLLLSLTRTHNPDDYARVWMN